MQGDRSNHFLVVSGEHPTLPLAEVKAVLEAYRVDHCIKGTYYKLVELEAESKAADLVARRAGFVEEAGLEIFHTSPSLQEIRGTIQSIELTRYLLPDQSFSIRVVRHGGALKEISRVKLESFLGGMVAKKTGARVNLRKPQKLFRGILAGSFFHFGLLTYQRPRGSIASRRPRRRPAFHPSTMVPKLARCMVNLAHATEGAIFLDPFCGVGGIILEASLLGCDVVGMDALDRMVRGTGRNLAHYGMIPLGVLLGDARSIPLKQVDAIATDPPYGTGASTLKATTREILEDFLPQARAILPAGRRAVIASPLGTGTWRLAESNEFKIVERHQVYVHRSLTRDILVLEAG